MNGKAESPGGAAVALALSPFITAWEGWMLWLAWRWWAVPLGAVSLPYGTACAAVFIVGWLTWHFNEDGTAMDRFVATIGVNVAMMVVLGVLGLVAT